MQIKACRPTESVATQQIASLLELLSECEIVDLSRGIVAARSEGPFRTRVEILEARAGARFLTEELMPRYFPDGVGSISESSFPDASFLRHELVTASTHAGSHVDAPGHYGGPLKPGAFVSDAEVRLFIGEGVLFECTSMQGEEVTWDHIQQVMFTEGIGRLAGKIVLIRMGESKAIAANTVSELLDRGVHVIGTDGDSFDGPFRRMLKKYVDSGEQSCLWPCHVLGRARPYYQLENLAHLDRLPAQGFLVWAPPVFIEGATASWSRVLALVPSRKGGD